MRTARDLNDEHPGQVLFLDFDGHDFDQPVIIAPSKVTSEFWRRTLDVALGDLADLVAPQRLILCEGSPNAKGAKRNFDAECYRTIFGAAFPDAQFLSVGSDSEVEAAGPRAQDYATALAPGTKIIQLTDRDDRSDKDVREARQGGGKVLTWRHLESYLYSDEILTKLCREEKKANKVDEVLAAKQAALDAGVQDQRLPADDVKSASGTLYVALKRLLELRQRGNDAPAFALQVLVPLITEDTETYQQLRRDIFK